jgi:hypothetical protein
VITRQVFQGLKSHVVTILGLDPHRYHQALGMVGFRWAEERSVGVQSVRRV